MKCNIVNVLLGILNDYVIEVIYYKFDIYQIY